MQRALVDAGPLIALFDKDDRYHLKMVEFLRTYRGQLITTWPVITETSHMLDFNVQARIDFVKWSERDGVSIFQLDHTHISRLTEFMQKYSDLPMDLADGTLLLAAESEGIRTVISIDRDFYIYSNGKNIQLKNIFN
jgi:uncharacterized protein